MHIENMKHTPPLSAHSSSQSMIYRINKTGMLCFNGVNIRHRDITASTVIRPG
jgi:hypothetical protein